MTKNKAKEFFRGAAKGTLERIYLQLMFLKALKGLSQSFSNLGDGRFVCGICPQNHPRSIPRSCATYHQRFFSMPFYNTPTFLVMMSPYFVGCHPV
jgi:hypothetical protein